MLIHALFVLALASHSFATPAIAASADDSVVRKHVTFGVAIAPVPAAFRATDYLEPNEGVLLVKVETGSAADAAKLKDGDLVLAIDGTRVDETTLFATLRAVPKGKSFKVEFLRNQRWSETWAKLD